jgi:hypothetical protein
LDPGTLKEFFMWSTVINAALFVAGFAVLKIAGGWVYRMRGGWYSISRETFDTVTYALFATYKILILFFNLVPWLALELSGA